MARRRYGPHGLSRQLRSSNGYGDARPPNTITYLDDILIHGRDDDETLRALRQALIRLRQHDLRLNLEKSLFLHKETPYLGHSLSREGVSPGPDKTAALRATAPPSSTKEVRSFLGLVNYFRSYIPAFSTRAAPLYELTRPQAAWKRGVLPPPALHAFQQLKEAVVNATKRAFPTPDGTFHLFVDAAVGSSSTRGGLGACLMQASSDGSGNLRPIAFASRQLKAHEKNYSAFLLELQAAVFAIDHFQQHLRGRHFLPLFRPQAPHDDVVHPHEDIEPLATPAT
jgi:hypothetical protein